MKDERIRMSKRTKRILKDGGHKVVESKGQAKRVRHKNVNLYYDYNLLEHWGLAVDYASTHYDIPETCLKTLCFLYPKGYFTLREYRAWPFTFGMQRINTLQEKGLVEKFLDNHSHSVFTLSLRAKRAVEDLHNYMIDPANMPARIQKHKSYTKPGKTFIPKLSEMIEQLKKGAPRKTTSPGGYLR